jgi:hypothetical protein
MNNPNQNLWPAIAKAHKAITRTKGKQYAPTAREIQNWIDSHMHLLPKEAIITAYTSITAVLGIVFFGRFIYTILTH